MSGSQVESALAAKLLIVDDDPEILSQLRLALRKEYDVRTADNPQAAWEAIVADRPDLITLDLALDGADPETGFALLEKCLAFDPFMKIVLITGNDDEANALRAIDQGAADFFGKPVDIDELRTLLRRTVAIGRLERQNAALLEDLGSQCRLGALIGQSRAMLSVFKDIRKVAPSNASVLILGESGTGKELVAKEIRRLSSRATKPFVKIDCTAIPANLVESELFGHEKGAFTDARESRQGRLEMAQSGIVFLDEIGELPPLSQVKLLRFLQDHEIERVGGRIVIGLDVRVIAATRINLEDEVKRGHFREDLFYRLSVVEIEITPLRERPEDILLLAQCFLDRQAQQHGRGRLTFAPKARLALQQHRWPGNVRQLENRIERAVVMSSGRQLDVADLKLDDIDIVQPVSLRQARHEADRQSIRDALRRTGGNVSKAAEALGISRPSLHELLTKLQIRAHDYKAHSQEVVE